MEVGCPRQIQVLVVDIRHLNLHFIHRLVEASTVALICKIDSQVKNLLLSSTQMLTCVVIISLEHVN